MKSLNHYVTTYRNTEDLQFQFSRQLEKLYGDGGAEMEITDRTPVAFVPEYPTADSRPNTCVIGASHGRHSPTVTGESSFRKVGRLESSR